MQTNTNHRLPIWFNPNFITNQESGSQLQAKLRRKKIKHKQTRFPSRHMSRFPTEQLHRELLTKNSIKYA